jgi:hypothetical protein
MRSISQTSLGKRLAKGLDTVQPGDYGSSVQATFASLSRKVSGLLFTLMPNTSVQNMNVEGPPSFVGISLDFGSITTVSTFDLPPHWANNSGGSAEKTEANNVSLSPLGGSVTITITASRNSNFLSFPTSLQYAINNGATETYSSGFTASASDSLKIGMSPPFGANGNGTITVFANGTPVASIQYQFFDES